MFDLAGEVALVTGGAKGIGKGIAKALKQARAKIIIGEEISIKKKARKQQVNWMANFIILMLQIKNKFSMLFKVFTKNMAN